MKIRLIFAIVFLGTFCLHGQNPVVPIPVEVMFGNEQFFFQMSIKRDFSPKSKFGFFSVVSYTANYQESLNSNSIVVPVQFTYNLKKGFAFISGFENSSKSGVHPIIGFQHSFANRKFLTVSQFTTSLNASLDSKFFGLYEFKPPINQKLTFYNRLQMLYIHNVKETQHERSYLMLRSGIKKGPFAFGLAANLDQFGPKRKYKDNFGLFSRWEF